jgi:hypothetical protein
MLTLLVQYTWSRVTMRRFTVKNKHLLWQFDIKKTTHCDNLLRTGRGVQHYVIKFVSDSTGRCFSPGPPVSSTNKTDLHDITEILFGHDGPFLFLLLVPYMWPPVTLWRFIVGVEQTSSVTIWYRKKQLNVIICYIEDTFCNILWHNDTPDFFQQRIVIKTLIFPVTYCICST